MKKWITILCVALAMVGCRPDDVLSNREMRDLLLRHVLQVACAEFVFDLPHGLDTELGERGMGLSEGQAGRIAVARGLLRPGRVLLLDEISSALDEPTERELFRRLFAAYPNKTMIFITHRSAVAEMDGVETEKIFYN